MKRLEKIWLHVDALAPAADALAAAVEATRRSGAELTIVGAIGRSEDRIFQTSFGEHVLKLVRKDREARVLALEEHARRALPARDVRSVILEGEVPWHSVAAYAGELRPDLLVLAARPATPAGFDPVSQHFFRKASPPVWAVQPGRVSFPRRVLAAVEPGPGDSPERLHAQRVLELARRLGGSEPLELHVVHAWRVPAEEMLRATIGDEGTRGLAEKIRERAGKELDELVAGGGPAATATLHLPHGDPESVIPALADELDADLVVLGSVARTGLAGLFIGGTAEAILARLTRSALVVKPPGFVSPVRPSGRDRATALAPRV